MNILTLITVLAALLVLATIAGGVYFIYKDTKADQPRLKKFLRFNLCGFIPTMAAALVMFAPTAVAAATGDAGSMTAGMGYIGAALSTGLACVGAGYAVGVVGSAALGAVSVVYAKETDLKLVQSLVNRHLSGYAVTYEEADLGVIGGIIVRDTEHRINCDFTMANLVRDNSKQIGMRLNEMMDKQVVK